MPFYVFRCPQHGDFEERLGMDHPSLDAALCPVCGDWSKRRYTPLRVQNLTASANTLRSWGRDLRVERGVTDGDGLVATRRARDEALAREGVPPPRAATME